MQELILEMTAQLPMTATLEAAKEQLLNADGTALVKGHAQLARAAMELYH